VLFNKATDNFHIHLYTLPGLEMLVSEVVLVGRSYNSKVSYTATLKPSSVQMWFRVFSVHP